MTTTSHTYPALWVTTTEVGVIHGSVTIHLTDLPDGRIAVHASYLGSTDQYTVEGSPTWATRDHITRALTSNPGRDTDGNRIPVTLANPTRKADTP